MQPKLSPFAAVQLHVANGLSFSFRDGVKYEVDDIGPGGHDWEHPSVIATCPDGSVWVPTGDLGEKVQPEDTWVRIDNL